MRTLQVWWRAIFRMKQLAPLLAQLRYAARVIQAHYRSAYAQRIAFRSSQQEAEERAVEFEKQWVSESNLRKVLHNQLEEMVGNLRVYCRIRPASAAESICCAASSAAAQAKA